MAKKLFDGKVNTQSVPKHFMMATVVSRFENRYQAAADAYFEEISWKQMIFLQVVRNYDGVPSIKDVAEIIGCTHQNANKLTQRLVSGGYLTTRQDKKDRRKQRLYLTARANAFFEKQSQSTGEIISKVFGGVTEEEVEMVLSVFARLDENLDHFCE